MTNAIASTEPVYEPGWLNPVGIKIFHWMLKTMFAVLAPIKAYGKENIALAGPGGFIVASNHVSYWDAPLMYVFIPDDRKLTAFGADKYRHYRFFSFILRMIGVIWVNRDAPSPATVKAAVQVLRNGQILGVAPEGTRSRVTRALQEGKTGAVYLALTAGVPVVPVAVIHTDQVLHDLKRLRRSHVSIIFGRPIRFPTPARHEREAKLQEYTTELMCQIAALLPVEYRGVYANHPRLKQLLNESASADLAEPRPSGSAS